MEFLKRHDMAEMASMTMSSATSTMHHMTMSMASATESSATATSTSSDTMDMSSMHSHMDMAGMNMWLTKKFYDYPVLFETLKAKTKAQAFGIFVLLFAVAFISRGFEFLKLYLEQRVWKNPAYLGCEPISRDATTKPVASCCGANESDDKAGSESENVHSISNSNVSVVSRISRDFIRLMLCIIPELLGYALMLSAMSFVLTYFFAIVIGLGVGRFTFERLSDNMRLRAVTSGFSSTHC